MKKTCLLKSMLLLFALIVGSVNGWADNNVSTVTTTFSANGTVTSNFTQSGNFTSAAWNLAVTWKSSVSWQNLDAAKGSQIGSGKAPATSIVLTGSSISGTITSVVVNTSGASSVNATVAVSVGGTEFKCGGNSTASLTSSAANYTFTGSSTGNIVITWTNSSEKAIYIKSITTNYSSGTATTTTIDATGITNTDVYTSTAAGSLSASVTEKTGGAAVVGATVTWSSSDDDVATIGASTGVVTLVSAGSVTFTATYAGNATYAGSNATYNMTVTTSAPPSVFYKVTDASTLRMGDQLLIVCEDANCALADVSGTVHGVAAVTITSNTITSPSNVAVLTLGGEVDAWTLKSSLTKNYLSMSSYNNELKESNTADADGQKWSISISGGEAIIVNKAYPVKASNDDTQRYVQYNYNSGNPRFASYASTQTAVSIYRICKQVTITNAEYATYRGDVILNYSGVGIKAFIAKDNGSTIGLTEITNGQVPAGTPVILYKAGADGTAINVPVIASTTTVIDDDDNDLEVSDGTTAKGDDIYVLAKNPTVGFYKWKSASSLSEGKIYLKASTPSPTREFIGFDDETTGINAVENGNSDVKDAVIYNLNGQRVVNPSKGLYIVNGKKVIIK